MVICWGQTNQWPPTIFCETDRVQLLFYRSVIKPRFVFFSDRVSKATRPQKFQQSVPPLNVYKN